MKKKKTALFIIVLVLAAAIAGACIYFYPVWKSAVILGEHLDLAHFAYEMEIELDRNKLGREQEKLLENLAGLTGFEEEAIFRLTVRGKVWEDVIHVMIYPKGALNPLVELYLSDDIDVINETLPYNAIRRNLVARYGILDYIMPDEKEAIYMTLEQAEQIFEVDLKGLKNFELPDITPDTRSSAVGCFLLLAAMSREKTEAGNRFETKTEQSWLRVELSETDEEAPIRISFAMQEPGKVVAEKEEFFSRLGIALPGEQLELLESISAVIIPGAEEEIQVPSRLMDQKKAELLTKISKVIRKVADFLQ